MKSTRREFLRNSASLAAAGVAGMSLAEVVLGQQPATAPAASFATPPTTRQGEMLYRTLGRTGEKVSLIGLGGYHLGAAPDEGEAIRVFRTAVDRGINFMDNCWDYVNGVAETRMGTAMRDGYRQKVFLMTKFDGRTKANAMKQIDESLKRLQTDHVDLIQFHEQGSLAGDAEKFFAEGGACEAMLEAKKAGKARYIGFTGHKAPAPHLRMLELAAQRNFRFDAVQMPLSVLDAHFRSFEREVLPVLVRDQIGVLAMKTLAFGRIPAAGVVSAIQCLHYAMNLPSSVVITGIESMDRLEQAFEATRSFKPMTQQEVAALLEKTKVVAATGLLEGFKTTTGFDGMVQHPTWAQ